MVGRLAFVSSVVTKVIDSTSARVPRVLLHVGNSSPAAIATYAFLKAMSLDIMVTVSDLSSS